FKKQADYKINSSVFEDKVSILSLSSIKDEEFDIKNKEIYSKSLKRAEERAANNVKRLAINKAEPFSEQYIPIIEKECGMAFGKEQREAFFMFRDRGIKILTGGPGTGKTTTVKGLILNYRYMHPNHKIKLAAPTGRAAQRLAESTGMPAQTVHKLLNYVPYGDNPTCKDGNDPIDADFIVIDEASMLDIELFDMLLEAVKNDTTILLVGDIHQLESVGAGAVLRDLLSAKTVNIKHTFLTEVFRQKGGSPIIDNSIKINNGEFDLETTDDFQVFKEANQIDCFNRVKELYLSLYNSNDLYDTQILCPSYKGESGIDKLNVSIRDTLNPNGKTLVYGWQKYRVGDKVIMTKNNMELGYYNGDIGVIKEIVEDNLTVSVKDTDITLSRENFDDLSLAYAITVHRSQGSEFENVIVVLPKEPKSLLVRNLFYTAVTRAKKRVFIVTEGEALKTAIITDRTDDRRTKLSKLICN
ncbi:MAG: AAA family ATPase, partial [Lachnospiraceae bacterium]|nr:AAA family ATPase [Lachnospiraceae bacterium]